MLLDGDAFRLQLEGLLSLSKRFFCYSAFFTEPAANWLLDHRQVSNNDRLLVRGLPIDFHGGSCSFEAIKKVLYSGMPVKLSSALHAKIYTFDNCVYSGSANLTARGLALCENNNQELGVRSNLEQEDLALLDHLWSQSVTITSEILEKMEKFVDQLVTSDSKQTEIPICWPMEIVIENRDLYCSDFPQNYPTGDFRWQTQKELKQTAAYKWLYRNIRENGDMRFGFLSQDLHNKVFDDPAPYRREIKNLLANLLMIVSDLDKTDLEVVRPRHSQIVRLKDQ